MILVYGHKRGGTTWLAEMLGLAVPYLGEVMSIGRYFEEHEAKRLLKVVPFLRNWRLQGDMALLFGEAAKDWIEFLADGAPEYVVKIPHPDMMPWLDEILMPDHVVRIDRHPLGVINSYTKEPQWAAPNLQVDWMRHLWYAPHHITITDWVEKFVAMWKRKEAVRIPGEIVVQYEELCMNPEDEYRKLYSRLGLEWNVWDNMQDMITGTETGFRDVKKTSAERAYAWKHELDPEIRERALALL